LTRAFFNVTIQVIKYPSIHSPILLAGKCPASPALEGGVKGYNIKEKYLTGKLRRLGRELHLFALGFSFLVNKGGKYVSAKIN
jgi:hypothetical protein